MGLQGIRGFTKVGSAFPMSPHSIPCKSLEQWAMGRAVRAHWHSPGLRQAGLQYLRQESRSRSKDTVRATQSGESLYRWVGAPSRLRYKGLWRPGVVAPSWSRPQEHLYPPLSCSMVSLHGVSWLSPHYWDPGLKHGLLTLGYAVWGHGRG